MEIRLKNVHCILSACDLRLNFPNTPKKIKMTPNR